MNDAHLLNPPPYLASLWTDTQASGFTMASEPLTGALLRTLATSKTSSRFLEIGSGTGLSAAWLLDGMDANSHLITVDNDAASLSILKRHFGADPRLTVVCADGDAFLQSLHGQRFDFIFADTWAGKYRLLDETLALLNPGGFYLIDDMCQQANWPEGHAKNVSQLVSNLEERDDLRISKFSWASGIILATKR